VAGRFVADSALEESGFEPLVPLPKSPDLRPTEGSGSVSIVTLLGLGVRREPTPLIGDLAHDIAETGIFRT
jgi:hypothetical protein